MAQLAGDFGKLRLPLPKTFSGEPSDWEDWSWNFKSYLAIFQQDSVDFLARSDSSNMEIVDAHFTSALPAEQAAEMRMFPRKLHYLLANLCTGSARLLVRQNEAGNGFETWRRLSQRFSLIGWNKFFQQLNIHWIRLDLDDQATIPGYSNLLVNAGEDWLSAWIDMCVYLMKHLEESPEQEHSILFHCYGGINSSSAGLCAWMIFRRHTSAKEAIQTVLMARPSLKPWQDRPHVLCLSPANIRPCLNGCSHRPS